MLKKEEFGTTAATTGESVEVDREIEKLRLLSTLAPPFLLSAKAGSHSTTETPLRNYKPSLMSSKLPASSQNLSKSTSMWST